MASNNGVAAREARRRKIIERGSDRLALITGRIPTSSPLDPISYDQNPSMPTNPDATVDSGLFTTGQPPVQSDLTSAEPPSTDASSDLPTDIIPSPSLPSSSLHTPDSPVICDDQSVPTHLQTSTFFTPAKLSSAVAASKRSRLFASALIAVLVVLSYLGHPLIDGSILKSITSFRPLYLVLLTDVTLVLARLFFDHQRVSGRPSSVPSSGENDWIKQAGEVLQAGLAMQRVVDALVMDCSIYTIITVCGVSLVNRSAV